MILSLFSGISKWHAAQETDYYTASQTSIHVINVKVKAIFIFIFIYIAFSHTRTTMILLILSCDLSVSNPAGLYRVRILCLQIHAGYCISRSN